MRDRGIGALMLLQHDSVTYFTGYRSWMRISRQVPWFCLVPSQGDPIFLANPLEVGNARLFSWTDAFATLPFGGDYVAAFVDLLRERGYAEGTVGAEMGAGSHLALPLLEWHRLVADAPKVRFVNASDLIWTVRATKSRLEIERLRAAAAAADAGVEAAWAALQPGITERELARVIARGMLDAGADIPLFLVVRSGDGLASPTNKMATDRRIERGDVVTLDIGCVHRDYCSDTIRSACLGRPSTDVLRMHGLAVDLNAACRSVLRSGLPIADLEAVRAQFTHATGLPEAAGGVGHSIGLTVHEPPYLGPANVDVLREGMTVTIEPGFHAAPHASWRIEDTVVITTEGYDLLTHADRNLQILT